MLVYLRSSNSLKNFGVNERLSMSEILFTCVKPKLTQSLFDGDFDLDNSR